MFFLRYPPRVYLSRALGKSLSQGEDHSQLVQSNRQWETSSYLLIQYLLLASPSWFPGFDAPNLVCLKASFKVSIPWWYNKTNCPFTKKELTHSQEGGNDLLKFTESVSEQNTTWGAVSWPSLSGVLSECPLPLKAPACNLVKDRCSLKHTDSVTKNL
jgi:hypothetical protein